MILQGTLITLRPLNQNDVEKLYKWRNDPFIRKNAALHPFIVTKESEEEWLNELLHDKSNSRIYFGIQRKENNELIGYTSLTKINWNNRNCYFGIIIGDQSNYGKGMGQEAIKMTVNYAFKYLNLHKVLLEVLDDNAPAIHIYEKLGFSREGILKEHFFWEGNYYDVKVMAVYYSIK